MPSYAEVLKSFRLKSGLSQRALARAVSLNPTLVNRSEAGDRPPSDAREIDAIAHALGLSIEERDQLLASAGYWPAVLLALGPGDITLRRVADALSREDLPQSVRDELRVAIEAIVSAVQIANAARAIV